MDENSLSHMGWKCQCPIGPIPNDRRKEPHGGVKAEVRRLLRAPSHNELPSEWLWGRLSSMVGISMRPEMFRWYWGLSRLNQITALVGGRDNRAAHRLQNCGRSGFLPVLLPREGDIRARRKARRRHYVSIPAPVKGASAGLSSMSQHTYPTCCKDLYGWLKSYFDARRCVSFTIRRWGKLREPAQVLWMGGVRASSSYQRINTPSWSIVGVCPKTSIRRL